MAGLWRYSSEKPEGKYLVMRRDGSIPDWPNFVIGAKDPAAPAALRAYADAAAVNGFDPEFVRDILRLAGEFEAYRRQHGTGDPDSPPHRVDDVETIGLMKQGNGS